MTYIHKFNKRIKWIIPNEIRQYVKKVNISTWEIFSQENITLKPKEVKFIMLGIGFIISEGVILTSVVYILGFLDHPFSPIYHHFFFLNQHQDHFSNHLKNLKNRYIIQLLHMIYN